MTDFFEPKSNITQRAYYHLSDEKSKIAFYFENENFTYLEALKKIENMAKQLADLKLEKGDSVLILLPLGKELIFTLLALMRQGIVPILIDPRLDKKLWEKSILKSRPKMVISQASLIKWHWLLPWTWQFDFLSVNKKVLGANFLNLNTRIEETLESPSLISMSSSDSIIKTLTSGSTGEPKIISRSFSVLESQQRLSCKYLPYLEKDIHLSLYGIGILQSFIHGSSTIVTTSFAAENIYQQIQKYQATRLSIPPGMLWELILYCEENKVSLPSLKCILTGGAPIPLWFRKKLKSFFPHADCYIVFGSTECEPISKLNLTTFIEKNIVGYPVGKNIDELEILKISVGKIKNQEVFKISLKGSNCAGANDQGLLNIGDLASFDEDGQIWLLGRENELYKGIPAAYIEELSERITGVKRALFLREQETNFLFLELLETNENLNNLSIELKEIQTLITDLGLGSILIYKVRKLPVDPRHLWKIQRQHVSSLLKDFCYDKITL